MLPPPGQRPFRRATFLIGSLVPLLSLSACGLWSSPVPAAPASTTPTPAVTAAPSESAKATPSSTPAPTRPSGFPTYSAPPEAACALPADVPESVAGANGPTLTAKRVEKAWKKSDEGRSLGVTSGRIDKRGHSGNAPGLLVEVPGAPWVALDIMEWSSVTTIVLADPGVAAARIGAVRAMVRQPCSYSFGMTPVVARITRDEPDLVVVTGVMQGTPITDTFVRYGNTVTHAWMTLVPPKPDDIRSMVGKALSKA